MNLAVSPHSQASCWGAPQMAPGDIPDLQWRTLSEEGHWMVLLAYREHKGGHGCQELRVDHGEDRGQVALPGPHKEQPVDTRASRPSASSPSNPGRVASGEGLC